MLGIVSRGVMCWYPGEIWGWDGIRGGKAGGAKSKGLQIWSYKLRFSLWVWGAMADSWGRGDTTCLLEKNNFIVSGKNRRVQSLELFNGKDDELNGEGLISCPSNPGQEVISEDLHIVRVTFQFHNISNKFYDNISNNRHGRITF